MFVRRDEDIYSTIDKLVSSCIFGTKLNKPNTPILLIQPFESTVYTIYCLVNTQCFYLNFEAQKIVENYAINNEIERPSRNLRYSFINFVND